MAFQTPILPSAKFRKELAKRGGSTASRCFQCATCSSVCQLAPDNAPFPRRQMLLAQWGLSDRLAADPAVWLCHQCNDCTERCPRDAKPGDVMQTIRSLSIESLATPGFMGALVGNAKVTWPLLLGIPLLFWVVLISAYNGLTPPNPPLVYKNFVPHWMVDTVFISTATLVVTMASISAVRFWNLLGTTSKRSGSFISSLIPALIDILVHKRFSTCNKGSSRRFGHMTLFFGFVGAFITTGIIALILYGTLFLTGSEADWPLPLTHPVKILGNISAILLAVGGVSLLLNRLQEDQRAGASTAYDIFFLSVVVLVVVSGILTEIGRFTLDSTIACWIYIVHLTSVLCLFLTFPFSKFAHMLYRTLAMVHEHMATSKQDK